MCVFRRWWILQKIVADPASCLYMNHSRSWHWISSAPPILGYKLYWEPAYLDRERLVLLVLYSLPSTLLLVACIQNQLIYLITGFNGMDTIYTVMDFCRWWLFSGKKSWLTRRLLGWAVVLITNRLQVIDSRLTRLYSEARCLWTPVLFRGWVH